MTVYTDISPRTATYVEAKMLTHALPVQVAAVVRQSGFVERVEKILFQPRSVDGSSCGFTFDERHDPVELIGWIGPELDAVTPVFDTLLAPVYQLADLGKAANAQSRP